MLNSPNKPQYQGELSVFKSPYSTALCVDIAVTNKYNQLTWHAVKEKTPLYKIALVYYLSGQIDYKIMKLGVNAKATGYTPKEIVEDLIKLANFTP